MKKVLTIIISSLMIISVAGINVVAEENVVAKIGETTYTDLATAVAEADTGEEVDIIAAGTYSVPASDKNITIKATVNDVVFSCIGSGSIAHYPNGVIFDNVSFIFGNSIYHGFQHAGFITMNNCKLDGLLFSYGNMEFNNCIFTQNTGEYNMWAYGKDLTYNNCTFNSQGKFINVYCENNTVTYNIICNNCNFNSSITNKSALNVKETCGANLLKYNVELNNCTTNENFPTDKVGGSKLWMVDDQSANGETCLTVKVDNELVYPKMVAKIDNKEYMSLQAAVDDATDNQTITLLDDIDNGGGVDIEDKNLTIDLNGYYYTVTKDLVGSTGTKNQAFHFGKDATVTLKNGGIFVNKDDARFIIQNYADLTLEDIIMVQNLDDNNIEYCVSSNNGVVNIIGNTAICADDDVAAIDCSWWPSSYADGTQINIDTTGIIQGIIELGLYGNGSNIQTPNKSTLTINNIKYEGNIVLTNSKTGTYGTGLDEEATKEMFKQMFSIQGGEFEDTNVREYVAQGKTLVANTNEDSNIYYPYMIGVLQVEVDVDINSKQVENKEPQINQNITDVKEKTFAEEIATKASNTQIDLRQEAAQMVNNPKIITTSIVEKAKSNDVLQQLEIDEADISEKLEIFVETTLKQEVTGVTLNNEGSLSSYKVDITPMYTVKAKNKVNNKTINLDDDKVAEVDRKIEIKIYLPNGFVTSENERIYVKHRGNVYGIDEPILSKKDDDGFYIEFVNPDGFSEFELSLLELKPDVKTNHKRTKTKVYVAPVTGIY